MKSTAPLVYNTETGADCHTTSYPTTSSTAAFHSCALKLCQENIQNETVTILIDDD